MSEWMPPAEFDGYRLLGPLGRGGMGRVFLAHDVLLERPVAIKFIANPQPNAEHRLRFLAEGRAIARLTHPNVVAIHRVGEVDGRQYLVAEYVRGRGLDLVEKPLSLDQVLAISIGLARGLAAAHRSGILHRDIKPSNAVLSEGGEIKLLDFGLASLDPSRGNGSVGHELLERTETLDLQDHSGVARSATVFGTPRYMAPELLEGGMASRRSDIFSLGAVVYELCCGRFPEREPAGAVPSLRNAGQPVHPRLLAVVERCLVKDPTARFASAEEVLDALEQVLPRGRSATDSEENPYRGLRSFEAEHSDLFFGRDSEIRSVLERLRSDARVIVAGDSGVGKSSLCRAGVLARLEEGALGGGHEWRVLRVLPGKDPVQALARAFAPVLELEEEALAAWIASEPDALARALQRLRARKSQFGVCLFLDQGEELFTLAPRDRAAQAGRALGALQTAASFRLLVAVRGDFVTRLAALDGFGEDLSNSLFLLRPLSAEKLREVAVGPIRARGWSFESEQMVEELIDPVRAAPGALPLLQFALAELWDARDADRRMLAYSALEAMGGVTGALAHHADTVMERLTADQRDAVKLMLPRLVTVEMTRARKTAEELRAEDGPARAALEALVRERLVVVREVDFEPVFELAHEALAREWGRLREWLDSEAGRRRLLERLSAAAVEWERAGKAPEATWRGRRLAEALALDPATLAPRDAAFLTASRRARLRSRIRLALLVASAPLLFVLAVIVLQRRSDAETAARVGQLSSLAESARTEAQASAARAYEQVRAALALYDESIGATANELLSNQSQARWDGAEERWRGALDLYHRADAKSAEAIQNLESALAIDPRRQDLRSRVAQVIADRLDIATRLYERARGKTLMNELALWDIGGVHRNALARPGAVLVADAAPSASYTLERYEEMQELLRPVPVSTPAGNHWSLNPGTYRLTRTSSNNPILRTTFRVAPGGTVQLTLPGQLRVPESMVYIPGGPTLIGASGEEFRSTLSTVPPHVVSVGAFLISRTEVTFRDWIRYLDDLPQSERIKRQPRDSNSAVGSLSLRRDRTGAWVLSIKPSDTLFSLRPGERLEYPARSFHARHDWQFLPVAGISPEDASHYLKWLTSTGQLPGARFCRDWEWERAARGSDDRTYVTGYRLPQSSANVARAHGTDPRGLGPDEVAQHPDASSPFGVQDMVGNALEIVQSDVPGAAYVARSGAWYLDPALDGRISARGTLEPASRSIMLGLRVCAALVPQGETQ
jgi:serine/threonine protein kinase/formylglycine-generating enzyme required for sulfatase activity